MNFLTKVKKYKKYHKIKSKKIKLFSKLTYGTYGLQITQLTHYKVEQLNLIIKLLKKCLKIYKKKNVFLIKKLPDIPITHKPKEIRMGRGKGLVSHKIAIFFKGQIIMEIKNLNCVLEFYICKVLKNKIYCLKIHSKHNNIW